MSYNYIVTAHKPTAVTRSLVGNFTGPTVFNLILCKSTRLEIYSISESGLEPLLDVGIYGRIAPGTVSLFRVKGEKQDLLFISTEKYKFCVLAYDAIKGEIITRANGDIHDNNIYRPAPCGQIGVIDPECRMIGLYLYEGYFKVIPIDERGQLQEAYNVRLEETQIISIKFLHGFTRPTIVVLYQDNKEARHVRTYEVSFTHKSIQEGPWHLPNIEGSVDIIITLPKPFGGIIIVGEYSIIYHNGVTFSSLAMKPTIMKVYGLVDANGQRILMGDQMGRLYCLILKNDGEKVTGLQLEPLGETSCPSTISYLDNGVVFVGSTYGDSQLIKLIEEKNPETGQLIEILESYTNLGPIVDFQVVDMDRQEQGQVVTCSGNFKDGSLRIIRNGIGINEHAQIDLPGIKGVWSLNPPEGSNFEKYLVVSFVGETRVLAMAGEELEENDVEGFDLDQQTLFCGDVTGEQYAQITSKGIYLVDAVSEKLNHQWLVPEESRINVASCNKSQILVCTQGKELNLFEVCEDKALKLVVTKTMPHEVSCLNLNPVGKQSTRASLCAVGLWTDISVQILSLPDLQEIRKVEIGGDIIPRSVLFKTFDEITYLMIALGDGNLISFTYDLNTGELENKKKISLGTRPVTLNQFSTENQRHVFACSDHPTVIHHSSNKKLLYANVNLKEVNYMCDFDCPSFSQSIALATEKNLTIGSLDQIQKLHIRTVPLGEMPRRICFQESTKTFCLLTTRVELNEDRVEMITDWVKLVDGQTFEIRDSFSLQQNETVCSVQSTTFTNSDNSYYIVGTAYTLPGDPEPKEGRLLVFMAIDGKLRLQAETIVKGAVYSLCAFHGKILAGVNSKVQLFRWKEDGKELSFECDHIGHTIALFLATSGDFIIVGDLMKSITLLVYTPVDGVIKELARDFRSNWMTAVSFLDEDNYVGAENFFNIISLQRHSEAILPEERGRLEPKGDFHVGEFINRFRKGSLVMKLPIEGPPQGAIINTTLLFGTISGSIGVLASIDKEHYLKMEVIQNALGKVIKGVGGFSHEEWRAFYNERNHTPIPSSGFLDGDLIESYLDLSLKQMEQVAIEAKMGVDEIYKQIEILSRQLH